jgi:type I restriction enzyme R subunit
LHHELTNALAEKQLKQAICRLNPVITTQPKRVDKVIHKLRAILITVNTVGLVRANQKFSRLICDEMTLPFGKTITTSPSTCLILRK